MCGRQVKRPLELALTPFARFGTKECFHVALKHPDERTGGLPVPIFIACSLCLHGHFYILARSEKLVLGLSKSLCNCEALLGAST